MSILTNIEDLLRDFKLETKALSMPTKGKVDAGSEGISSWLNNMGNESGGPSRGGRLSRPISKGHSAASAAESVGVHEIKERLLKFVNGEPDDDHSLVNMRRLSDVGMDHRVLAKVFGDLQKRGTMCSTYKRVQLLGLALYMNTLALPEAARLGLCLSIFHDKRVEDSGTKGDDDEDDDEEENVEKRLVFLSKEDVMRTCRRHLRDHKTSKATGKMIANNAETVMDLMDEAVSCRVFDAEVFLSEYAYGFHLPRMAQRAFEAFVEHHERTVKGHVIDVDEDYCYPDVMMTLTKNVATLEDLTLLKNDVFRYTLPQRYHIKDGGTETMMDVVLDSVAGADFEIKSKIYEAVRFNCMSGNEENTMLHLKTIADKQFDDKELDKKPQYVAFAVKACAVAIYLSIFRMARPTEWPFKAASAKDCSFRWDYLVRGEEEGETEEDSDGYVAAREKKKNFLFWETGVFYMISERHIFRSRKAWPLLSRYVCELNS